MWDEIHGHKKDAIVRAHSHLVIGTVKTKATKNSEQEEPHTSPLAVHVVAETSLPAPEAWARLSDWCSL